MALAPTENVVLGSCAFAIFWVLAVFPAVPFLPIGRTAGSLLGAMLMIIFKVITPEQAFSAIDLSVLGLLFGTMVVSFYLERAGMFKYLGLLLSWRSHGAKDLLCRICIVSAISSALFTNDTTCVVLTEFIVEVARQNDISPHPFLLALASSANIGSSATPIGNPQNLVIALKSRISFGQFLLGLLPSMLVGVSVNVLILLCMYWKMLSVKTDEENPSTEATSQDNATSQYYFSPETRSKPTRQVCCPVSNLTENTAKNLKTRRSLSESDLYRASIASKDQVADEDLSSQMELGIPQQFTKEKNENTNERLKRLSWKACTYLVILGMLIALLLGLNMSWTALTAALVLVVLDFKDAGPCLEKVSYPLLVFFCGMFITVEGFNNTGIPSTLWTQMEPHARINHIGGISILAFVILLLSNVASNVPTVLLLGTRVASSAASLSKTEEKKAWLILAWVSTVAGNLSLLGSAANLIVCEKARGARPSGYALSFWTHLKFGLPSTIIITAIGLSLIRG